MTATPPPVLAVQDHRTRSRRSVGQAALLGLALFLVSIGTFAPESAPDPGTASAADVRRFAIDNAGTLQVNTVAALASLPLLVMFVVVLAQQVRQVQPWSIGPQVMVCLVGVVATQDLFVTATSSIFALPDQLAAVTDQAAVTLYEVTAVAQWLYTLTVLVPCMALVATYSWLALRERLLARWICWAGFTMAMVGAVTAVILMIPAIQFDAFVLPLFGWWLWPAMIGSASAVRWWRSRQPAV